MKNFKIIVFILLVITISLSFYACDNDPIIIPPIGEVVEIPEGNYENLADLLIALDEAETIEIAYSTSEFGIMLTSIKGAEKELVSNDNTRTYISIYLSTNDINYIDTTINTIIYDSVTYYGAALGASSLPVINGASYLLCTVTYGEDWISSTINEDAFIIIE
jgi:hypothetical protein